MSERLRRAPAPSTKLTDPFNNAALLPSQKHAIEAKSHAQKEKELTQGRTLTDDDIEYLSNGT
jgi:hypothetical protein